MPLCQLLKVQVKKAIINNNKSRSLMKVVLLFCIFHLNMYLSQKKIKKDVFVETDSLVKVDVQ